MASTYPGRPRQSFRPPRPPLLETAWLRGGTAGCKRETDDGLSRGP